MKQAYWRQLCTREAACGAPGVAECNSNSMWTVSKPSGDAVTLGGFQLATTQSHSGQQLGAAAGERTMAAAALGLNSLRRHGRRHPGSGGRSGTQEHDL